MEIATTKTIPGEHGTDSRSSSFDCDPCSIDVILGRRVVGDRNLRIDSGVSDWPLTKPILRPSDSQQVDIRYAISGLEEPQTRIVRKPLPVFEITQGLRQERLSRLLDQQQAWYDAQQKAALAAEQLLQLCEHHQQPWLQDPIRT
jgi:hypothetical protein